MLVGNFFSMLIGIFLVLIGRALWWHSYDSFRGLLFVELLLIIIRMIIYYHHEK